MQIRTSISITDQPPHPNQAGEPTVQNFLLLDAPPKGGALAIVRLLLADCATSRRCGELGAKAGPSRAGPCAHGGQN